MIEQLPEIPRLLTAVAEWLCCLLCIWQIKFRFPKPITGLLAALGLGGQIGLQLLAGTFDVTWWILGMILNVAFMAAFIALLADAHVVQIAYWTAVAFIAGEFIAAFEWQITCYLVPFINPTFDLAATAIAVEAFIAFSVLFLIMEKKVGKINKLLRTRHAMMAIAFTAIAFTISNLAFVNGQWNSTLSQQHYVYFIRTLVDFAALAIMYLQQWTLQEQKYEDELGAIQNVLNSQYKQYLDFKESSEYIARQCHDLKHQIEALRSACTNEEREEYLQEMEKAINLYRGQNVTGNAVLDTLLTKKKIYCLDHNIDFSMKANGKALSFLAVKDICTIMGNLLDNAIEYVSGLENADERQIQGEIFEKGNFLMIRIENYYQGNPVEDNKLPKTTKIDKKSHGYGLKSVKYIAEKYEGSMTVRTENDWFIVRVLLPIPTDCA